MSGFLPRLFGKSQYQGEARRMMNEMQDIKTNQRIAKLESELKASKSYVEELQGKLEATKVVLEKKDAALDDITRDREKVALELKNADLCNKYMKEQLEKGLKNLERDTRRLLIEKSNFQTRKDLILGQITLKDPEKYPQSVEGCSREITRLQRYTQSLLATLLEREKTIATLCEKFLLLKFKRTQSVAQLNSLKEEFDEISRDLLRKLEDARNEINMLADAKYQDPMDKKNFALVQMVQKNGELILENSTLKLEVSQLKQSVTCLRLETSSVDINTRTLEMRSVPSSYTLRTVDRQSPFKYGARGSDVATGYQRSINAADSNAPSRCYNSCASPRSAPSSILTYKPKRGKIPLYVTQENSGGTSRRQETASEKCSTKSHQTEPPQQQREDPADEPDERPNKPERRKAHRAHDKRKHSRRKREMRRYTSDSSVGGRSQATGRLMSELHPSVTACDSKESVEGEKSRGQRTKGLPIKEDESLESIYSVCYLSPTRSTPGRVETTPFVRDETVSNSNVNERTRNVDTKCN